MNRWIEYRPLRHEITMKHSVSIYDRLRVWKTKAFKDEGLIPVESIHGSRFSALTRSGLQDPSDVSIGQVIHWLGPGDLANRRGQMN